MNENQPSTRGGREVVVLVQFNTDPVLINLLLARTCATRINERRAGERFCSAGVSSESRQLDAPLVPCQERRPDPRASRPVRTKLFSWAYRTFCETRTGRVNVRISTGSSTCLFPFPTFTRANLILLWLGHRSLTAPSP